MFMDFRNAEPPPRWEPPPPPRRLTRRQERSIGWAVALIALTMMFGPLAGVSVIDFVIYMLR